MIFAKKKTSRNLFGVWADQQFSRLPELVGPVQCSAVQCSTVQYSTVQYSTVLGLAWRPRLAVMSVGIDIWLAIRRARQTTPALLFMEECQDKCASNSDLLQQMSSWPKLPVCTWSVMTLSQDTDPVIRWSSGSVVVVVVLASAALALGGCSAALDQRHMWSSCREASSRGSS